MKTKLLLTGLALIAITAFASAQDPIGGQGQRNGNCRCNGKGRGIAFVDANKDGICDNIGNGSNASGQKGRGNGPATVMERDKVKGKEKAEILLMPIKMESAINLKHRHANNSFQH